jgi:diguanylate cyclase (GGDEF)-like protein
LYDLKSVPTDRIFPGVEIHTTFINNLLNNEFIKKTSIPVDITISLIFGLFIGLVVVKSKSTIVSSTITTLSSIVYIIATIYAMLQWNLWIGIILPLVTVVIVFISCYIAKYIIKSRDLEYTYALATTDGLTDLYNHRYFQEQMQQNIATSKRYNKDFSLIMIDIDYFKKFNDTYGHQSGDAVLRQVAQILKKNVRSSDIVCRYGGEEMAIILTNTGNEEALITAQKICKAVSSQPLKLVNGNNVNVTISLGVATCPLNGDEPAQMIKYADDCLYKAKEHGRNQVGNLAED